MTFENAWVLWLLPAVLPLVGAAMLMAWHRDKDLVTRYGDTRLFGKYSELLTHGRFALKALFLIAGLALLLVALARPVKEFGWTEFPQGKLDLVTLVDVSRSMGVPDYQGQLDNTEHPEGRRLDMARHLIQTEVIPSLNYNRIGIVSYSGSALPVAFLTDDMLAVDWVLKRALTMGSAPGEGSEMGKAFDLAFSMFELDSDDDHRKVIVLFSDGGLDADIQTLHKIVSEIEKRDIELIIVGMGKPLPSPIPIELLSPSDQGRFRDQEFYEFEGQVVTSKLEQNTLMFLRNRTGGRYVRVVDSSDFNIGTLVSGVEIQYKKGKQEMFPYALMLALAFSLVSLFAMRATRRQKR